MIENIIEITSLEFQEPVRAAVRFANLTGRQRRFRRKPQRKRQRTVECLQVGHQISICLRSRVLAESCLYDDAGLLFSIANHAKNPT
jgi:hypothetical protein